MASNRARSEETRRKAQEKFTKTDQREKNAVSDRNKATAAVAAKTARLRSLRLAKEAVDKEAAAKKAADKTAADKAKTTRTRAASA